MVTALLLTPLAYLLGAFPTAVLVARAGGRDVLGEGSGNPGASNVLRLMGWRAGLLVFAGDLLKGTLPALAGLAVWGHAGAFILGFAAVLGHVFPATRGFRGGRGVATGAGVALALYPLVVLGLALLWALIAYGFRYPSVASIVVVVALPGLVWLTGEATGEVVVIALLSGLVLLRHAANIRRLVRGQELRLDAGTHASDGDGGADGPG